MSDRFRLARAGVLNVWQYDDQIFEFAEGRLLLRGSNGAGKSKTLEMLLPFVLDGDRARMTASGRHHTSLLWLMLDGYQGQNRAGYLWVELERSEETITCGVGIRASQSTRSATPWYFTVPGRIGRELYLEDDAGPLARERLKAAVEAAGGHYFEAARAYKQHVGRTLFGLDAGRYDELLRLLYWLRQPQVGEDIEPARLAEQLANALPALDDDAVRAAGDTFDELAAFGEQLDRQRRCADGVAAFARAYAAYAREVVRTRGAALLESHRERTRRHGEVARCRAEVERVRDEHEHAENRRRTVVTERSLVDARLVQLRADPVLRNERALLAARELAAERERSAEAAQGTARSAQTRAGRSAERVRRDAVSLAAGLVAHGTEARHCAVELAEQGARVAVPAPHCLQEPRLETPGDAEAVASALQDQTEGMRAARPVLGELRAAVEVVDGARREEEAAATRRAQAEKAAAEAERHAEEARGLHSDAVGAARAAEGAFTAALDAWSVDPRAVPLPMPEALTSEVLASLPTLARTAAEPVLVARREEEKVAAARRTAAEQDLRVARELRAAVAAETDPAPPAPAWSRDTRAGRSGAPLWRLVDFAPDVAQDDRAGLEAALEASGLLDAWVRPDGGVLEIGRHDTVLPAGASVEGAALEHVLVPDGSGDAAVAPEVVRAVLARIGAGPAPGEDGAPAPSAWVAADGRWRLGPLTGRATKARAQYVGATARAAERARRLAELEEQIATLVTVREAAATAESAAREAAGAIEEWLAATPPSAAVVAAWARLEERALVVERSDRRAATAEQVAADARAAEAARRAELVALAATHALPMAAEPLAARREALRDLDAALASHAERGLQMIARVQRWAEDATAAEGDLVEAQDAAGAALAARDRAAAARATADEMEETIGASVAEIRRRIEVAEELQAELERAATELERTIAGLLGAAGAARQAAQEAASRLAEHEPVLAAAVAAVAALAEPPGLLESGGPEAGNASVGDPTHRHALDLARSFAPGQPVAAIVLAFARDLAALPAAERGGTETAVFAAWQDAASGPTADVDPRVVEVGDALAVVGRDETGEHPIGALAQRLAAAVARDAELLTERERRLFEEHILGDLGESLRARRQEAEELVAEMNTLLRGVTTSQGIAVALRWSLRDDVAADARRSVELLGRPVGALLPDERRELRDALHRLIEASRADAPEDAYAEHLARALDYRRWFAFRVRYTRPETAGTWHDLHRRSALSQGEQKVVCYLPLFAAAAAHFSSLAGAAPHSPRFILLDDAFPKIDVRTHPLLFGLLVQLDLDFVITSERLWGDHDTVPALAIYEALRDPTERGIAQYRHLWDGHRLQAVGA